MDKQVSQVIDLILDNVAGCLSSPFYSGMVAKANGTDAGAEVVHPE